MKVYRISQSKYADDLNGTGAKRYGGRWNAVGTPCIYTSESRALATLEYAANVNIDFMPSALSLCIFQIKEDQLKTCLAKDLPKDWKDFPTPSSTKSFGSGLLKKGIPIIKIPSIIIPDEFNYILNPLATEISFKRIAIQEFHFDMRLKE